MQNAGFIYGIMPALKKIYPDKGRRLEVIKSHLEFFNTHPYMVGIIMGMTVALEERAANDTTGQASRGMIQVSKNNMACPLAAIGDVFFWALWRPMCAMVMIFPISIFFEKAGSITAKVFFFGFLIMFNSLNFAMRYYGVMRGYQLKEKIVKEISAFNIQKIISIMRNVGLTAVCLAFVLYFFIDLPGLKEKITALCVFVTGAYLYRKGVSSTTLFFGLLLFFTAACLMKI